MSKCVTPGCKRLDHGCRDCHLCKRCYEICFTCNNCLTCNGIGCQLCKDCVKCFTKCKSCNECLSCVAAEFDDDDEEYHRSCYSCELCINCAPICAKCNKCIDCRHQIIVCKKCTRGTCCFEGCTYCRACLNCVKRSKLSEKYCENCVIYCKTCNSEVERNKPWCKTCCERAIPVSKPFFGRINEFHKPNEIDKAVSKILGYYDPYYNEYYYVARNDKAERIRLDVALTLPECFQGIPQMQDIRKKVIQENLNDLQQIFPDTNLLKSLGWN